MTAIHRGAELVTHVGEEFALGAVGGLGPLVRLYQFTGPLLHQTLQTLAVGRERVIELGTLERAGHVAQQDRQQLLIGLRRVLQRFPRDADEHPDHLRAGGEGMQEDGALRLGRAGHLDGRVPMRGPGEHASADLFVDLALQRRACLARLGVDHLEAETVGLQQEEGGLVELEQSAEHGLCRAQHDGRRDVVLLTGSKGAQRGDQIERIEHPLRIGAGNGWGGHVRSSAMTCTAAS